MLRNQGIQFIRPLDDGRFLISDKVVDGVKISGCDALLDHAEITRLLNCGSRSFEPHVPLRSNSVEFCVVPLIRSCTG